MKVAIVLIILCLIPILVRALELDELARKERGRRRALASHERGRTYRDADLEIYHRSGEPPVPPLRAPVTRSRDLVEERAFWREEKVRHDRELARLDAQIRRLEWRLAERKASRKPGERLRRDPTAEVLAESIQTLRKERALLVEAFRERARKAGALPGWLR